MKPKEYVVHIAPFHYVEDGRITKFCDLLDGIVLAKKVSNGKIKFFKSTKHELIEVEFFKTIRQIFSDKSVPIQIHDFHFFIFVIIFKIFGFKNIIIDHHENFLRKSYFLKPIVYMIYLVSKLGDSHFFATAGIKKQLSKFYAGEIIRNIPSRKIFNNKIIHKDANRKDLSMVYIGHLSKVRQIEKIESFIDYLYSQKKDFSLVIAGPIKDHVAKNSINRLQKYSSFKYYSWADDVLKQKILNQSNFGFSLHDGKKNENLKNSEPTKVWEYLCTNTFVIMSEVENLNEIYSPEQTKNIFFWDVDNFSNKNVLGWMEKKISSNNELSSSVWFEDQAEIINKIYCK